MYLCPLLACRPISWCSPSRADNPLWTERTHGLKSESCHHYPPRLPSLQSAFLLKNTIFSGWHYHLFFHSLHIRFKSTSRIFWVCLGRLVGVQASGLQGGVGWDNGQDPAPDLLSPHHSCTRDTAVHRKQNTGVCA